MADYHPLLARAVAVLPASTLEARRAIYGRARDALLAQLRAIDPPIDPDDIQAESDALDAAAARLEGELAAKAPPPPPASPAAATVSPSPPPLPRAGPAPVAKPAAAPASVPPPVRPAPPPVARPALTSKPLPPRPSGLRPLPPRPAPARPQAAASAPPTAPDTLVEPSPPAPPTPALSPSQPIPPSALASAIAVAAQPLPPPAALVSAPVPVAQEIRAETQAVAPAPPSIRIEPDRARPEPTAVRRPLPPPNAAGVRAGAAPTVRLPSVPDADVAPALTVPARAAALEGGPELGPPAGLGPKPRKPGFLKSLNQSQTAQVRTTQSVGAREALAQADALSQAEGAPAFDPTEGDPIATAARPSRGDRVRPAAPQRKRERSGHVLRNSVAALILALVVGSVGAMAYMLRDRPEDLARLHPSATTVATDPSGKIGNRVGGAILATPSPTPQAAVTSPPPQAVPVPAPTPVQSAASAPAAAPLAVAQRAALLLGSTDVSQQVATYVGTVVWRLDNVSHGQQPLTQALRADIDIPDAKLKASLLLQKNTDDTLSATHTMEVRFLPASDSPIQVVRQIDMPQMRNEDAQVGDPLTGIRQPVQTNYFVVALVKGDAVLARNVNLLRSRNWIDIAMQLDNGRIAKLTFEKGTPGDRALTTILGSEP